MPTTLPSFTKQERNKMRKIVKILRENFRRHMQEHGVIDKAILRELRRYIRLRKPS